MLACIRVSDTACDEDENSMPPLEWLCLVSTCTEVPPLLEATQAV